MAALTQRLLRTRGRDQAVVVLVEDGGVAFHLLAQGRGGVDILRQYTGAGEGVGIGDGRLDGNGGGAVVDVQERGNKLMGELEAGVAANRRLQQRFKLSIGVEVSAQREARSIAPR